MFWHMQGISTIRKRRRSPDAGEEFDHNADIALRDENQFVGGSSRCACAVPKSIRQAPARTLVLPWLYQNAEAVSKHSRTRQISPRNAPRSK